jgi:hypothetical protein
MQPDTETLGGGADLRLVDVVIRTVVIPAPPT